MEKSAIITTPLHQNHTKYPMATFIKRGKTWRCQVTKKVGGEIVRRSGTFPTKSQAVAWAIETESGLLGIKRTGLTGAVVARDQRVSMANRFDPLLAINFDPPQPQNHRLIFASDGSFHHPA